MVNVILITSHFLFKYKKLAVKKFYTLFLYCIISISFVCGCAATRGKEFNYQNRKQLNLKITTIEDALRFFGSPFESKEMSNEDGNFKRLVYTHIRVNTMTFVSTIRQLILEFKDGLLNGYTYISGFSHDSTDFNYDTSKNIKVKISNKKDVLNIMSAPTGKILCPSYSYSTKCKKGKEIWTWGLVYQSQEQNQVKTKKKILYVVFDENGIVTDVEALKDIEM